MKKSTLILSTVLSSLILITFGFINWNNPNIEFQEKITNESAPIKKQAPEKVQKRIFTDFIYDIGPRFVSIKKTKLDKIKSFNDFISNEHAQQIVSYKSVSIIVLKDDKKTEIRETGYSDTLTPAQIKFLQSLDYSTNILVWANYQENNKDTGELEDNSWTPYLTIVPEKQARYTKGLNVLKKTLKEKSEKARKNVDAEKLKPAKLYFTVTKKGTIENVKLDRSSGYPLVDKTMIELINKTQAKWQPAENYKGEKVDQELVVSFGLIGC